MSDIVERARKEFPKQTLDDHPHLGWRLADEVERLRADCGHINEFLRADRDYINELGDKIMRLQAEVERLRAERDEWKAKWTALAQAVCRPIRME